MVVGGGVCDERSVVFLLGVVVAVMADQDVLAPVAVVPALVVHPEKTRCPRAPLRYLLQLGLHHSDAAAL